MFLLTLNISRAERRWLRIYCIKADGQQFKSGESGGLKPKNQELNSPRHRLLMYVLQPG